MDHPGVAELLIAKAQTKPARVAHVHASLEASLISSLAQEVEAKVVEFFNRAVVFLCQVCKHGSQEITRQRLTQGHGKDLFAIQTAISVSHTHSS